MNLVLNLFTAVGGVALLIELLPRAGRPMALLAGPGGRGVPERWGTAVLLGVSVLGSGFLGLGAAGLFSPVPLAGLAVAAVLAGSRGAWTRSEGLALLGHARNPGRLGLAALAVVAAMVVVGMLLPSFEQDSYAYHLGVSWGYLQAHRLVLDFIPHTTHQPLLFDVTGVLCHLVRDERLMQWLVGVSFAAATAIFAGRSAAAGVCTAGVHTAGAPMWLAFVLPFASPFFFPLLASGKNDVAAAALFVAGALCWGRRGTLVGALLLGCSMAAKFVYGPLIVVWVLAFPPRLRRTPLTALLLFLPSLPWWTKTWLATGNPLYPFGWTHLPSLGWGGENQAAMDVYSRAFFDPATMRLRDVPGAWVRHLFRENPHHLFVIPLLVAFTRERLRVVALSAAQVVTLAAGHIARFLVPSAWLIDLLAVRSLALVPGRRGAVLTAVLALTAAVRLYQAAGPVLYRRPDLLMSTDEARAYRLPSYDEATRAVAVLRPRRLLCIGELRTFRVPGRCVFGGAMGETPVMWKLARESRDPAEFSRKIRQLGTSEALYNLVGAVWVADRYGRFLWSDRDLAVYQGYLAAYCPKVERISKVDESSGGFYLYRFSRRQGRPVRESRWFLPGAENVNAEGLLCERRLQFVEGTRAYLAGLARIPAIGQARNLVGHGFLRLRNLPEAEKYLAPFAREGMADLVNLLEYATVLMELGKYREAVTRFEECQSIYPGQQDPMDINLSWSACQLAYELARKGNEPEAVRLIGLAEVAAFRPGGAVTGIYAGGRKMSKAMVLGTKAEMAWRRGDRPAAGELYRKALEADPGGKLESHWQARLAEMEGRTNPAGGIFGK